MAAIRQKPGSLDGQIGMRRYDTRTKQFGLSGGMRQTESDYITVFEPTSLFMPETRKGSLYIVPETDNELSRGREACQLINRQIRKVFYDDDTFSITAALRAAIRAANQALYKFNFDTDPAQRAYVGVTCVVIRGADLYIAQVTPAQAYLWCGDRLRTLPSHAFQDTAQTTGSHYAKLGALGASLFVEPDLYRNQILAGDALLVCSSNMNRLLADNDDVAHFLRFQDPSASVESLLTLCEQQRLPHAHGLVIEIAASRGAPVRADTPGRRNARMLLTRTWAGTLGWLSDLSDTLVEHLPGRRQAGNQAHNRSSSDTSLTILPEQPQHSPNPPSSPRPLDLGESVQERRAREQREMKRQRESEQSEMPPSAYLGEDLYEERTRSRSSQIDLSDVPALAARARPYRPVYELRPLVDLTWQERIFWPVNRLRAAYVNARRSRLRPSTPPRTMPRMRGQGLSYRRQKPPFPWLQLSLLGLLVTLLIIYGMNLSQRSAQQRALDYFAIADQRIAAVREAQTETLALDRLDVAREAMEEVRASALITDSNPGLWVRYQEMQREYERLLSSVQRQTFFENVEVLATHPLTTGTFASIVVPQGSTTLTDTDAIAALDYLYALDGSREIARLYRIPRDGGTPQPFLSPNQTIQTTQVGPVRAQTWRVDNIVAIDDSPSGYGYYFRSNGQWNYTRLGGSDFWTTRGRIDMETYEGNLYVWGVQLQEILKFTSGRYSEPALPWLDPAGLSGRDLSTAIDMAIDGNIYLLMPDGQIIVLNSGRFIREITPSEITPPITTVTRFFITGSLDSGWIFLLDPLNERVIQLDKMSGEVIQQIKVRPEDAIRLDQLADIFVDTSRKPLLYLVNGGQILRTELPEQPRPFGEYRETAEPAPATPTE
jgi:hypothetical protein